jgi:hypothetical protein
MPSLQLLKERIAESLSTFPSGLIRPSGARSASSSGTSAPVLANGVSLPPFGLPQELLDTVIEHLCDDVLSLRACSLVSKCWRNQSQMLLFRTISPTNRAQVAAFIHIFDTSPHIALGVRRVILRFPGLHQNGASREDDWFEFAYCELGRRLHGATYLRIHNWQFWYHNPPIEEFLPTGFPSLTHLTLRGVRFGNAQNLLCALESRPSLTHLEFGYLFSTQPLRADVAFSLPLVETFEFDFNSRNETMNSIPRALAAGNMASQLRAVRLSNLFNEQVPVALDLLCVAFSTLQYLNIGFASAQASNLLASESLYPFPSLFKCSDKKLDGVSELGMFPNIHQLTVQFSWTTDFDSLCQVLTKINAPKLRALIIRLGQIAAQHNLHQQDKWELLAQSLVGERWIQTCLVTFTFEPPAYRGGFGFDPLIILERGMNSIIRRALVHGTTMLQYMANDEWEKSGNEWDSCSPCTSSI